MKETKRNLTGLWDETATNEITSIKEVWKYGNKVRLYREFIR